MNKALPGTDRETSIGVNAHGEFIYPSSRWSGVEQVAYLRRNFHPKGGAPQVVQIKQKDLPGYIIRDLRDAHRKGDLRQELSRQIEALGALKHVDRGTLAVLRGYQNDLVGLHQRDAETLESIVGVIQGLRPKER
jgi:hypothetical protein